jgi:MFS family permease
MAIGSFFWGRISDKYGRKIAFMFTLMFAGLFGLAAAFAFDYYILLVFICGMGFGIGGNLPVDGSMFVEFVPPDRRGTLMVLLSIFWAFGSIYTGSFAWALIPKYSCEGEGDCDWRQNCGWRYLTASIALTNLFMFSLRYGFPESPVFLFNNGESNEAKAVLIQVAKMNKTQLGPFELTSKEGELLVPKVKKRRNIQLLSSLWTHAKLIPQKSINKIEGIEMVRIFERTVGASTAENIAPPLDYLVLDFLWLHRFQLVPSTVALRART